MKKINFNEDWVCWRTEEPDKSFSVTIPYDALLLDSKDECSPSGVNNGWYDAKDYTYQKKFRIPKEYQGKRLLLEFEGVYHKAEVFCNDIQVAYHDYGYTGFFADITEQVFHESENIIQVKAVNSDQPNSRWYSGTGIYRPVWLHVLPKEHIVLEGIRITTLDYREKRIRTDVKTKGCGTVKIEILDRNEVLASAEGESDGRFTNEFILPFAKLWNVETPVLYTCRVTFGEDVQEERFGIRTVECTPQTGFCINGERVIIRGACIHHDNGLLGACAYDFAEERKIRILKENGYNAIRSAHNPCSKALLRACDELGMLVMDEYVDVWYIHKTKYDYASEVETHYKEDLEAIVSKDYNHPSVVMYSTGNEVSESAQKRGIALCDAMTRYLHKLDSTRPVSCGINIFFNFLSSMGFGVYSDKKADQAMQNAKKKKAVGSEFFNILAGVMGADFMKFGATLYPCDLKTRDAFAAMDVAGYNYGIRRYEHDLKKYPDRLILGSETFCSDAFQFWEKAKQNKRLIGDFVWSGMDYLGEVGIGSREYEDYAPYSNQKVGWVSAGSGRIDLTGKPLAEMKYTQVAFELEKIGIGVIPVNHTNDRHSPSAWKMTNAVESWSWNGCDGKEAKVEVYARADHISLFVNGTCVGTQKTRKDCRAVFKTTYHDGEVRAVAYDGNQKVIAEKILKTAGEETVLTLEPEKKRVKKSTDLCYVRLKYTDSQGEVKPLARGDIRITVQGGKLLGLGSACPYYPKGYLGDIADTYYGEALAIVKPEDDRKVTVFAKSPYGNASVDIEVEAL